MKTVTSSEPEGFLCGLACGSICVLYCLSDSPVIPVMDAAGSMAGYVLGYQY